MDGINSTGASAIGRSGTSEGKGASKQRAQRPRSGAKPIHPKPSSSFQSPGDGSGLETAERPQSRHGGHMAPQYGGSGRPGEHTLDRHINGFKYKPVSWQFEGLLPIVPMLDKMLKHIQENRAFSYDSLKRDEIERRWGEMLSDFLDLAKDTVAFSQIGGRGGEGRRAKMKFYIPGRLRDTYRSLRGKDINADHAATDVPKSEDGAE